MADRFDGGDESRVQALMAEVDLLQGRLATAVANPCMECQRTNDRLRKALEEIANQDFRGNRSVESQIAYRALHA